MTLPEGLLLPETQALHLEDNYPCKFVSPSLYPERVQFVEQSISPAAARDSIEPGQTPYYLLRINKPPHFQLCSAQPSHLYGVDTAFQCPITTLFAALAIPNNCHPERTLHRLHTCRISAYADTPGEVVRSDT